MTTAHGDERARAIDARVLSAIAPTMMPHERVQALSELRALLDGNRHRRRATTTTTTRGGKRTPWKPSGAILERVLVAMTRAMAMVEDALGMTPAQSALATGCEEDDVSEAERSVLTSSLCVKLVRDIVEELSPLCARASVGTKYKQLRSDWKRCEIQWTRAQRKQTPNDGSLDVMHEDVLVEILGQSDLRTRCILACVSKSFNAAFRTFMTSDVMKIQRALHSFCRSTCKRCGDYAWTRELPSDRAVDVDSVDSEMSRCDDLTSIRRQLPRKRCRSGKHSWCSSAYTWHDDLHKLLCLYESEDEEEQVGGDLRFWNLEITCS
jgi:hypothetical protein